jgi:NAD(P)H-dependent FMN reductase
MKIEIISGSPRRNSTTNRVALHLEELLKRTTDHEIGLIDMREHELMPMQSVYTSIETTPDQHKELARRMFEADAFILVTPEYNGGYAPAMKNMLDHFPKQHHKTFGIVTASPGAMGGMRAALQLQELVYALFGIGSPYMLVIPGVDKKFDAQGNLLDESFQKSIDLFAKEFLWLSEKLVNEKVIV